MVSPCNEIKKTAWEVLQNFDTLILREDDPLLPAILGVFEVQDIKNGAPTNMKKMAQQKLMNRKTQLTAVHCASLH